MPPITRRRRPLLEQILRGMLSDTTNVAQYDLPALAARHLQPSSAELGVVDVRERPNQIISQLIMQEAQAGARRIGVNMRFDLVDPRALKWADQRSAALITEISDSQRRTIRELVAHAYLDGVPMPRLARLIEASVGLTARQGLAVSRAADAAYLAALKRGMTPETADVAATRHQDRYAARTRTRRARTIARTELAMASNYGRWLSQASAVELGYADPGSIKRWIAKGAGRTGPCPTCEALNGAEIKWDQIWPSTGELTPPAHPNCGCVVVYLPPDQATGKLPPGAPPPKQVPPGFDDDTIGSMFNHDLGGGYTSHLYPDLAAGSQNAIHRTSDGGISVEGVIYDPDLEPVGHFNRTFIPQGDGTYIVEHSLFQMREGHQAQGLGDRFFMASIDAYRTHPEITAVRVYADISVGGYAWAVKGFDWANESPSAMIHHVANALGPYTSEQGGAAAWIKTEYGADVQVSAAQQAALDSQYRHLVDLLDQNRSAIRAGGHALPRDAWPTPLDLARIGSDIQFSGEGGLHAPPPTGVTLWPGKAIMLGTEWSGILRLH